MHVFVYVISILIFLFSFFFGNNSWFILEEEGGTDFAELYFSVGEVAVTNILLVSCVVTIHLAAQQVMQS